MSCTKNFLLSVDGEERTSKVKVIPRLTAHFNQLAIGLLIEDLPTDREPTVGVSVKAYLKLIEAIITRSDTTSHINGSRPLLTPNWCQRITWFTSDSSCFAIIILPCSVVR